MLRGRWWINNPPPLQPSWDTRCGRLSVSVLIQSEAPCPPPPQHPGITLQGLGNDLKALQQQLNGETPEAPRPPCHCLCTSQHIFPVAIYFCKKSAGPPGLGIETSFISRNGFQWRAKSNSHLQGRGRKRGSECRRYLGTLTSGWTRRIW